jgi:hypothetical protein
MRPHLRPAPLPAAGGGGGGGAGAASYPWAKESVNLQLSGTKRRPARRMAINEA